MINFRPGLPVRPGFFWRSEAEDRLISLWRVNLLQRERRHCRLPGRSTTLFHQNEANWTGAE